MAQRGVEPPAPDNESGILPLEDRADVKESDGAIIRKHRHPVQKDRKEMFKNNNKTHQNRCIILSFRIV